jgi:hypothetical protein
MALDRWDWQVPVEESRQVWAAVDDLAQRLMAADAADPAIAPDRGRSAAQARSDALAAIVLARTDVIVHLHAAVPEGSPTGAPGSAFSAPAEARRSSGSAASGPLRRPSCRPSGSGPRWRPVGP